TGAGLLQNSLGVIATANGREMYGLHPRLERLQELYGRGKLAIVANVGTLVWPINKGEYHQGAPVPLNLFSHSDQQQQWQMALIQKANQVTADGLNAARELNGALSAGSSQKTQFPDSGLGRQLQEVARIMNVRKELGARRQIFYVALGDFDTHTDNMRRQD